MEILHHFEYGNAMMNICRSTGFKEKMFKGEFFCYLPDDKKTLGDSPEFFSKISEENIPKCVRAAKYITRCLDNYEQLSQVEKEKCREVCVLHPCNVYFEDNKYLIYSGERVEDKLMIVQFYLKNKFKYNRYSKLEIEWSDETNEEYVTIDGEYPDPDLWKEPFRTLCIPYEGRSLHSVVYDCLGVVLNAHIRNPYCCAGWGYIPI